MHSRHQFEGRFDGIVDTDIEYFEACTLHHHPDQVFSDIMDVPLHGSDYQIWSDWLRLAGATDINPARGNTVDDTSVLIQAAIDGVGIALGSTIFVQEHLDAGRLVRPFDVILQNDAAYYAVCQKTHLKRIGVRTFWNWLLDQSEFEEPRRSNV